MTKKYLTITIHTDGGSRGNPGPAGIGAIAQSQGEIIFEISEKIGETTNNVAEYTAVIRAMEEILTQDISSEKLNFILDSELIVRQIVGKYKVKLPHLQQLREKIISLIREAKEKGKLDQITFSEVRREFNKEADMLVNKALDS